MAPSRGNQSRCRKSYSHLRDFFARIGCCISALIVAVSLPGQSYAVNRTSQEGGGSSVTTSYTCEGVRHMIVCPPGTVIYVLNAHYGRISGTVCTSDPTESRDWDLHCMSRTALSIVSEQCEGERQCSFTFDAEDVGDRCPSAVPVSADIGLTINHECHAPHSRTTTVPSATAWWMSRIDTTSHPVVSSASVDVGDSGEDNDDDIGDGETLSSSPFIQQTTSAFVTAAPMASIARDGIRDVSSSAQSQATTTSHNGTADGEAEPGHFKEAETDGQSPERISGSHMQSSPTAAGTSRLVSSSSPDPTVLSVTDSFVYLHRTTPGGVDNRQTSGIARCPAERVRSISWPATSGGHVVVTHCPRPAQGRARRLCSIDGRWQETPDMSECVSSAFTDAQQEVLSVRPEQALERIRSATNASRSMYGGDLIASANILGNVSGLLADSLRSAGSLHIAEAAVKDVLQATSNLFSAERSDAWHDLHPGSRMSTAARLLASIERNVAAAAENINRSQTQKADNAACIIEVVTAKSASEPNGSVTLTADGSADAVHIPTKAVAPLANDDGSITIVAILTDGVQSLLQDGSSVGVAAAGSRLADSAVAGTSLVNSRILSLTIAGRATLRDQRPLQLGQPFTFLLNHAVEPTKSDDGALAKFRCVFWDFQIGDWSDAGCRRVGGNGTFSLCECDHLTNFAILMDVTGTSPKLSSAHELSLKIITWIGCIISIICLLLSWLTFQCLKNLSCDRNTIHKNLVFTLCLAEMLFLFGLSETGLSIPLLCTVVAALLHFLFLAAFGWMCLEGVQLYVMLIEVFETEKSRIGYYYAAGYGIPAVIVAVSAGIDYSSYGTDKFCWLRADTGFIWSFVGPVAAVILVNVAMLGIAIHMMCRHASTAASIKAKDQRKSDSANSDVVGQPATGVQDVTTRLARTLEECGAWVKASAVLIVLLGVTWIFGFLYVNEETVVMAYVFTVLNSLQGLFIFLFHCVCNDKVQKEYRKFVRRAAWLPNRMRIQYGGHKGLYNTTSNSSQGSGNNPSRFSSFKKMLISVRRKRASTTSTMQQSGSLQSGRCVSSSNGTAGAPELNSFGDDSAFDSCRGSRQQKFTTFSKLSSCDVYDGMNGDLSYADASVIDSECVSDYCHYGSDFVQNSNFAMHYAVTCQQCGVSASRCDDGGAELLAHCACRQPLLPVDRSSSAGKAAAPAAHVQPYDVGLICKQARSQKGLSGRGLLQHESDEDDLTLSPAVPANPRHMLSFGRRSAANDDGRQAAFESTPSAGAAADGVLLNGARWSARDNTTAVAAASALHGDRTLRPSRLEPISEVARL